LLKSPTASNTNADVESWNFALLSSEKRTREVGRPKEMFQNKLTVTVVLELNSESMIERLRSVR